MAAVLGLVNRISVRYLLPSVSRLKCCHNIFFRRNYKLAKLRPINSEPAQNVQIRNGKVR